MHRLVIALTALLAAVGVAILAIYLLILGPSTDRAARLAPASTVIYASAFLTPSTAQQMELANLLGKLPGLSDQTALRDKLDEIAQRLISSAGLDYRADLKPWVGDEIAVALTAVPQSGDLSAVSPHLIVIAAMKDETAATAAIGRLVQKAGGTVTATSYQGVSISRITGSRRAGVFAMLNGMLVVSPAEDQLRMVIDVAQGRTPSLSATDQYRVATQDLPTDRLAFGYLDLETVARAAGQPSAGRLVRGAGLAFVAKADGLQLIAHIPVQQSADTATVRAFLEHGNQSGVLAAWMPPQTRAELTVFGAQQGFAGLESQLGSAPGGAQLEQTLSQLRALAALGLGIDIDKDLLPLFDGETAVAVQDFSQTATHGELLLRPSNAAGAAQALQRVTDALRQRGSQVSQQQAEGTTVTTVSVPQVGAVAYAVADGVVIVGLSTADVAAAIHAHVAGTTLGSAGSYAQAFRVAGARVGEEVYVDAATAISLFGGSLDLPSDVRDMLTHVGAVAVAMSSTTNAIDIHATVTVH